MWRKLFHHDTRRCYVWCYDCSLPVRAICWNSPQKIQTTRKPGKQNTFGILIMGRPSSHYWLNKLWHKSMQEGLLALSRYALSVLCCIIPFQSSSKQPTTSYLCMLICVRTEFGLISDTLGTRNSICIIGGLLTTSLVSSDNNQLIYDQTALGILVCSSQNAVNHRLQDHGPYKET